jgi:hypothetical protein
MTDKTTDEHATPYGYGYCPICGSPGVKRERRPDGNDTCENNHVYPSRDARKTVTTTDKRDRRSDE